MANILEDTLKKALEYALIKNLPELSIDPYITRSIVKVKRNSGSDSYCIGRFEELTQTTVIVKDFFPNGGFVSEVLAVYPIKEKALPKLDREDYENYSIEDIKSLFDKHNIPYPNNKKNDKKWLAKKLQIILEEREQTE